MKPSEFDTASASDQNEMLALQEWENARCPSCGSAEHEFLDSDGQPLAEPMWAAATLTCPGCAELERRRHQDQQTIKAQQIPESMTRGNRVVLVRRRES